MSVPQCFFSGGEGLSSGIVRFVAAGQYRDEVFHRSAEYARGRGQFGVRIRGVTVLQDCALKGVRVQFTLVARVVCNQTLDCFHTDLCPAIAVREGN